MNEKIRKLGVEAGLIVEEWDGFNRRQLDPAQQKFAELIVRECIGTLQDHMGRGKRDDYYRGQADSVHVIKQHFGVEE